MYMYLHLCDKETLMTTKSFVGSVYLWKGRGGWLCYFVSLKLLTYELIAFLNNFYTGSKKCRSQLIQIYLVL